MLLRRKICILRISDHRLVDGMRCVPLARMEKEIHLITGKSSATNVTGFSFMEVMYFILNTCQEELIFLQEDSSILTR